MINAHLSDRLLRTHLPKDEIQRRIYPFIPSGPRALHLFYCCTFTNETQEEYTWHPLKECVKELDKAHYACFAHTEHSSQTPAPERGQRRRSWNIFSSHGLSATVPEVPREVFRALPVLLDQDDGEQRIGSFSVCPPYPHRMCRLGSPLNF